MKNIWQNIYVRHVSYWIAAYVFVASAVLMYDDLIMGIKVATMVVLPAPVTVYLHFWILKLFFDRRKYFLYGISVVAIIIVTGFYVEIIFQIFFGSPGSHTAGFPSALFYILTSTGLKYYSEGLKNRHKLQEIEFKQLQTEMQLLKSQINPHFFFNTLNNLYALSLEKSEEVPEVILKISDLMRYVLESTNKKTVPLNDEIEFIKIYIELEKLRLEKDVKIKLDVEGNFERMEIAPMLLIPFVENSFKHGMKASINRGYVNIFFQVDEDEMKFSFSNSKPALVSNAVDSTQMGLENVRRRLDLLYTDKYELTVKEHDEEYKTELRIIR
jgi:sensor histidine kinase YesM